MKRPSLTLLYLALVCSIFFSSCGSSTTPEAMGTIRVTSVPTGAKVFLDGTDKGLTTDCTLSNVNTGSHSIKLTKAGYADFQGTATVTAGQTTNFNAALAPSGPPGALSAAPAGGFATSGPPGGPFTPTSVAYTLQNTGGEPIAWTASTAQAWTTVSPAAGNLAAGASTSVTVSLNAGANGLAVGTHSDTLTLTNTTNGAGNTTRQVSLIVTAPSHLVNVTIDYARVPPIPNPNGLDFPWVTWVYGTTNGTRSMAKVIDDVFTSPLIPIMTEVPVRIWVTDLKMDNGVTTRVCRTIKIDGQLLDVGATIYGEVTFIYGNDGIVRIVI